MSVLRFAIGTDVSIFLLSVIVRRRCGPSFGVARRHLSSSTKASLLSLGQKPRDSTVLAFCEWEHLYDTTGACRQMHGSEFG